MQLQKWPMPNTALRTYSVPLHTIFYALHDAEDCATGTKRNKKG